MKKSKKLLIIGVFALGLSVLTAFLVKAQDYGSEPFFNVDSVSNTVSGRDNYNVKGQKINVFNRSGLNVFVPNRTVEEWEAFYEGAPSYVSISVCGDGVFGEGETEENCLEDAKAHIVDPIANFCGDGICGKMTICNEVTPCVIKGN